MMSRQVTRIEPLKGQKLRIFLNDEAAFCLMREDLSDYPLCEGAELSDELYDVICTDVLGRRAKLKLLQLLQEADRTEAQLRQYLRRKEYPEEAIDTAVEYVRAFHYIDDQRYALHYIERYAATKSRREIRAALYTRGVSAEDVDQAFEEAGEADEAQVIRYWMAKKRFDPDSASEKETERFMASLVRRGISYVQIRKVISGIVS